MKISRILLASFHFFAATVIAQADDGFVFSSSGDGLRWRAPVTWPSVQLRITGDKISPFEQTVGPSSQFSVPLSGPGGSALPDGLYTWDVVGQPVMGAALAQSLAAARKSGNDAAAAAILAAANLPQGVRTSGAFSILNGKLVQPGTAEAPAARQQAQAPARNLAQSDPLIPLSGVVAQDQVTNDDLIVIGSLGVGLDSVNGQAFGFDTILLKENNLRIFFDDTSVGAFPANDWRIIANDSTSGGASFLAIEDSTAARQVFKISAGARANALFVSSSSKVGLGTSTPVLDLHIVTGNSPSTRLEQDGTSGFTPQTWDMAGNEANFFIRDVTGGSKLPFRIRPGAPTSSLDIAANGNIGIGTGSPSDADSLAERFIDIKSASNSARVVVDSADGAGKFGELLFQRANANKWGVGNDNSRFYLFNYGTSTTSLAVDKTTNAVTITGNLTVNGTFTNPSSRELKDLLPGADSATVLEKISSLPLFTWSYKNDEGVRHFGPVAEDFYERFQLGLDKEHISPNDMAGVALGAIKGLHEQLRERDAQINSLRQKSDALEKQLKMLTEAVEALKVGSPTKASP